MFEFLQRKSHPFYIIFSNCNTDNYYLLKNSIILQFLEHLTKFKSKSPYANVFVNYFQIFD
jgi:hypothetical protein